MLPPRGLPKLGLLAVSLLLVVLSAVPDAARAEFNFVRYKETDLDEFLARRRPAAGLDVYPMSPLKLDVTLASHGEPCASGALKRSLIMSGMPKTDAVALQATNCITVRSAKGRELKVFIQDVVYGFLPAEVPVGDKLSLYAIHAFTSPEGPGLLVNEFLTPRSFPRADKPADKTMTSCGCWTQDEHPGVDFTSDKAGGPVAAMADGVVVKIETSEQAPADLPVIGGCGRYVVLKHTYPNGGIVYHATSSSAASAVRRASRLRSARASRPRTRSARSARTKCCISRSAPSRPARRRRTRPGPSGMPTCPTWSGPATIPSIRRSSTRRRSVGSGRRRSRTCGRALPAAPWRRSAQRRARTEHQQNDNPRE
ncbi:hypothetical protein ABIF86_002853 [Bradyrhizobium japonicum]